MQRGNVKISQKIASSGSLDELKKLIAKFYVTTPDRIRLSEGAGCWLVMVGEKPVRPLVAQSGKRYVFGVAFGG